VIFLLPRLLPIPYGLAFPLVAGGALAGLVAVGMRERGPDWARRLLWYLLVGAVALVTGRYDIFPAGLLAVGVMDLHAERWNRAWLATTLGAALKLFPVVAWPLLLMAEWRARGRVAVARPALALTGLLALWALPAIRGPATWGWLGFFSHRPPNVGSLAGQITALLDPHFGMYASFGSVDIVAPVMGAVSVALMAAGVLAVLAVYWAYGVGRLDAVSALILVITVTILASKVLSVQYLIWLMPLWAWYPLSRPWFLAALLNTVSYPLMFSLYVADPWALGRWLIVSLAARNLALLAGVAGTVATARRRHRAADGLGTAGVREAVSR
jgi:hypothetical protein